MKNNKSEGFTLIELLVVIAIVGILATIVTGSFNSIRRQARANTAKSDVQAMAADIQTYISSHITPKNTQNISSLKNTDDTTWSDFWQAKIGKQKPYNPPTGSGVTYELNTSASGKQFSICASGDDMSSVLPIGSLFWVAKNGEFYDSATCPAP